jgi:hypothetical protein
LIFAAVSATALVALVFPGYSARAAAGDDDDSSLVLCLSAAERGHLVDAAAALGLGRRGSTVDTLTDGGRDLTLEDWRSAHPTSFTRSCAALVKAKQLTLTGSTGGGGGSGTVLLGLLSVVVGGLLGGFLTWRRDVGVRQRERAALLRDSAAAFTDAVAEYVRAWGDSAGRPSDRELRASRADLAAQLRWMAALHPRWTSPGRLRDLLSTGDLGPSLSRDWEGRGGTEHTTRAERIEAELDRLRDSVDRMADAVEHPLERHPEMRRRPAPGTGQT